MSHSEWRQKMRALKSIITLDELCELLNVEKLEDFQERIIRNSDSVYGEAFKYAKQEGASDEEAEARALGAESAELDEAVTKYRNAVTSVAERLFKEHNLTLEETKKDSWVYRITPTVSWRDSASKMVTTINGYGMFEFHGTREFLDSGPYTARQAVLSHLHWIPKWGEVYGAGKAKSMVDNKLRY